jgi:hypothetical protein
MSQLKYCSALTRSKCEPSVLYVDRLPKQREDATWHRIPVITSLDSNKLAPLSISVEGGGAEPPYIGTQ